MARSQPKTSRRQPRQARSRNTVEVLLEAAARVFRREGWRATTNRIAAEAGVSVGSLYEYFPDKQALLAGLAERHLAVAERSIAAALSGAQSMRALLGALQAAVVESQRYPSQALQLVTGSARGQLAARAAALRERVLRALELQLLAQGLAPSTATDRARVVFGVIGELTAQLGWTEPDRAAELGRELLEMAAAHAERV
jgi:AcrR family transcriptional regulator